MGNLFFDDDEDDDFNVGMNDTNVVGNQNMGINQMQQNSLD